LAGSLWGICPGQYKTVWEGQGTGLSRESEKAAGKEVEGKRN